MSMSRRSKKN